MCLPGYVVLMRPYYQFLALLLTCGRGYSYLLAAALVGLLPRLAAAQSAGWQPGFNSPGLNRAAYAVLLQPRGGLIAGGEFTDAGGHPAADYVARWDGRHWQPLGAGPDFGGPLEQWAGLIALPGGGLVAAGVTQDTARNWVSTITRWDGRRWQRLGPAFLNHDVQVLAAGPGGQLLAGFSSGQGGALGGGYGVLRWDGQHWQPLAPDPPASVGASNVYRLLITPRGDIVAIGHLLSTDGRVFHGVGRWASTGWQRLGPDLEPGANYKLAPGAGGELLLGGSFTKLGGDSAASYVVRWDGRRWLPFDAALRLSRTRLLLSPTGEVVRVAHEERRGEPEQLRLARWTGTGWQPYAADLAWNNNWGLADATADGQLLVNHPNHGLMRWDGRRWQVLADPRQAGIPGPRSVVLHLAVGRGGAVVLSGYYSDALLPGRRWNVSRWNGHRRRTLGPGFLGVSTVAVAGRRRIFAAGPLQPTRAGDDTIRQVGRWHGGRWHSADPGLPPKLKGVVGLNGVVLAADCGELRRWRKGRWQPGPGNTADSAGRPCVVPAAVAPNGDLIGVATPADAAPYLPWGAGSQIVRWDGRRWQALGDESLPFDVLSVAVAPNGDVYAAGEIRTTGHYGTRTTGYVLRWDGTHWQALGGELNGGVNAVAVTRAGEVYIGGAFHADVDFPAPNYVARWRDGAWQPLGPGLDREVTALVVAPNGDIVVGGYFTGLADGSLSIYHWGIYRER
jgi:hypothetical protein